MTVSRQSKISGVLATLTVLLSACMSPPGPEADKAAIDKLPRKSLQLAAGYSLSYLESGAPNGRLVVFVHGTPGDARGWSDYLLDVPDGFHYIAIDRPGFGQSGPDGAVVSLPEQAAAVAQVIRAQHAGRAILVGHSLGGPVVAQTAADMPELVSALVILAGSLDPAQENVPFVQYLGDTWPLSAVLPRPLRNANREIIYLKRGLDQLAPRLASISVPVVIVHGMKDDLVPFANVGFMKTHLADASFAVDAIPAQNHFLPWNAKSHVMAAIAKAASEAQP
ncbi:MAG: alpha/beta fold hydrolase [Alphaproteobacteria bacterium]|nr:alpha/beta fold hydrolase [Alphaproteobacteria bacterium]